MTMPLLGTTNTLPGRSSPASACQNNSARPRSLSARRCMMAVIAFGLSCTGIVVGEEQKPEHVWSYSGSLGPDHWGDLKPEFAACKDGHRQSPIDIRSPQPADLPAIEFNYKPSPLHIVDNGHTVMINYAPGSFIHVGDKRYELKQFHFHRPSEEKINGRGFDMVAHLVHADAAGIWRWWRFCSRRGSDNPLDPRALERPPQGERQGSRAGPGADRFDPTAACESWLLHLPRIAHHAALQRERHLVRVEAPGHDHGCRDREVFEPSTVTTPGPLNP